MNLQSLPTFNSFDGLLLLLSAISVLAAFRQGLVKAVFSVAGLIFGVLSATWIQPRLNTFLQPYVTVQSSVQVLSFLAVVVVIYGIFGIWGEFASGVATGAGMSLPDRLLGAGFGVLRAALVGAILVVTTSLALPRSLALEQSRLAPYLLAGTHAVSFVAPEQFRNQTGSSPDPSAGDVLEARATVKQ